MVWFTKPKRLDPARAAAIIDDFVNGQLLLFEWENFLNARHGDSRVAEARDRCAAVPVVHPPDRPGRWCGYEGLEVLRAIAHDLRTLDA